MMVTEVILQVGRRCKPPLTHHTFKGFSHSRIVLDFHRGLRICTVDIPFVIQRLLSLS